MNIIQVSGHMGSDPEVRFTPSGQKVTTFRVASNKRRGDKEETIWWRITVWGDRFDKLMPYLKKGKPIIAIGEMNTPSIYTNKDGQPQVSLEVTAEMIRFSPFGKGESQEGQANSGYAQKAPEAPSQESNFSTSGASTAAQPAADSDFNEDDLPF